MPGEGAYYIDLGVKFCVNDGGSCLIDAPIFSNTKLPKLHCSWQKGFTDPSKLYQKYKISADMTICKC